MRVFSVSSLLIIGTLTLSVGCAPSAAPTPTAAAQPTAAAAASSAPTAAAPVAANGSPIKLGVLADLSGPFAPQGAEMRISTDLAVKQWNDAGGVDGRPIQVEYVDPRSDATQALDDATRLVQQDHVDALIGAVGSNECAAVENLVAKLGVVYVTSSGCAAEEVTSQTCNKYTFRFVPQGRQTVTPMAKYLVQNIGPTWGIVYPDYAFGQSQLMAFNAGLEQGGGSLPVVIAVPLSETNMTPYVSKLPVDGSIDGVYVSLTGAQLTNAITTMQQFGITSKLRMTITGGKEGFGGVYPEVVNGAIFSSLSPEDRDDHMRQFARAFSQMAQVDSDVANIIGGAAHASPGAQMGYSAYAAINGLKEGMLAVHYAGPQDTDRLIQAMANLKSNESADFPGGDMMMDPNDHQGRMTQYVSQIDGQGEKVLSATPANQVPPIGTCKAV